MKSELVATWNEVAETFLLDEPPQSHDYEACLFVNRCEVRKTPAGKVRLNRRLGTEYFVRPTEAELDRAIVEYVSRPDVRRLRPGLQTNDGKALPLGNSTPTAEVLAGTADIYQPPEPS